MQNPIAIVGDTHGCFDEFLELEAKLLKQYPGIRILLVGDVLDKGPKQLELLQHIIDRGYEMVLGNHEEKHVRFKRHDKEKGPKNNPMRIARAKRETREHNTVATRGRFAETNEAMTDEQYEWLKQLPFAIEIPEYNVTIVHAGVSGSLRELPLNVAITKFSGKYKKIFGTVLWTRFIGKDSGNPKSLGKEAVDDPYWAEAYDGRFGQIVFGHQPFSDTAYFKNAIGVDTGCALGNKLSAVVFDNGNCEVISVPALRAYESPWGDYSFSADEEGKLVKTPRDRGTPPST